MSAAIRFIPLGRTVATAAVNNWLTEDPRVWPYIKDAINRHQSGEWGELCKEDWAANDFAATNEGRLLSAYTILGRKVWIITEWDRSVTTVLFPEDY